MPIFRGKDNAELAIGEACCVPTANGRGQYHHKTDLGDWQVSADCHRQTWTSLLAFVPLPLCQVLSDYAAYWGLTGTLVCSADCPLSGLEEPVCLAHQLECNEIMCITSFSSFVP